ncbi:MAG TPA: 1-acyl-sn-glycerol-3-phosphate acyltransferase [Thermoanaerobaculia bacterium]|nr:1-acyl-sn-glycerol-3-phosphate acyltransferase [Thermoanaerobaculia bacterium]
MRDYFVFLLLLLIKSLARLFYRLDVQWIGDPPPDAWHKHKIVAILNHTSLYEALFAGVCPNHFHWRLAHHGVLPLAQKTAERAVVGRFYSLMAKRVIPITRQRDESWKEVLRQIDPDAMVMILPEGRMKRANGLDSTGKPMTVRGGIADIVETIGDGRMLLAYSGGLHHIQVPGERWPRLFKTIRLRLELIDIGPYRDELMAQAGGPRGFKRLVVDDLERRRDLYCPIEPGTDSPLKAPQPQGEPSPPLS